MEGIFTVAMVTGNLVVTVAQKLGVLFQRCDLHFSYSCYTSSVCTACILSNKYLYIMENNSKEGKIKVHIHTLTVNLLFVGSNEFLMPNYWLSARKNFLGGQNA